MVIFILSGKNRNGRFRKGCVVYLFIFILDYFYVGIFLFLILRLVLGFVFFIIVGGFMIILVGGWWGVFKKVLEYLAVEFWFLFIKIFKERKEERKEELERKGLDFYVIMYRWEFRFNFTIDFVRFSFNRKGKFLLNMSWVGMWVSRLGIWKII